MSYVRHGHMAEIITYIALLWQRQAETERRRDRERQRERGREGQVISLNWPQVHSVATRRQKPWSWRRRLKTKRLLGNRSHRTCITQPRHFLIWRKNYYRSRYQHFLNNGSNSNNSNSLTNNKNYEYQRNISFAEEIKCIHVCKRFDKVTLLWPWPCSFFN